MRPLPIEHLNQSVQVYRNLNDHCLSVMQNSLVVGHAMSVILKDVEFIVHEEVRRKAVQEGRKNVHAFADGKLIAAVNTAVSRRNNSDHFVQYDWRRGSFYDVNTGRSIWWADYLLITTRAVSASRVKFN